MKAILFLLLSFCLSLPIKARIGETAAELVERYGKPIEGANSEKMVFLKNDIYVTATVWKGTCHQIIFSSNPPPQVSADIFRFGDDGPAPETKPTLQKKPELQDSQIKGLLEANNSTGVWKQGSTGSSWIAPGRFANLSRGLLEIITAEYAKHLMESLEKESSKRVEGF